VKDKIRRSNWEKEVKLRITEGDKKKREVYLSTRTSKAQAQKKRLEMAIDWHKSIAGC